MSDELRNDCNMGSPEEYDELAEACISAGRIKDAVACYRESLATRQLSLGPNEQEVADSLVRLAGALVFESNNSDEPIALWTRAVAIYAQIYNAGVDAAPGRARQAFHGLVDTLGNLACAAFERGENVEAEQAFRRMQSALEKEHGASWQHPTIPTFARVLSSQGKREEAEQLLKRATDRAPGPDSVYQWSYPECLVLLGGLYRQSNRFGESERCYLEAACFVKSLPKVERETLAVVYDALRALYLDADRGAEAERLSEQIASLREVGKE